MAVLARDFIRQGRDGDSFFSFLVVLMLTG